MKSNIYLLFLAFVLTIYAQSPGPGYSSLVTIGPKYYVVGINLNVLLYPKGTAYNINKPSDPVHVNDVMQRAITDIGNNGGGVVHFKQGTYVSIKNLFIYGHKIHLKGDGIDKTIIKLADYAPSFIIGNSRKSGFVRTRSSNDLIVSNMTLDGNRNKQYSDEDHEYGRYGFFTEGSTNVWLDRVKVINFQGYGFDPHGWKSEGIWGRYLTLTNCVAENNGYDGFTLDQSYYIYVDKCIANRNGRHGFNIVTGSKYVNITNSVAYFNGYADPYGGSGCGFMTQNNQQFGTSDVIYQYNTAIHSKKAGFCMNDVYNIRILNNYVNDTNICLHFYKARSTAITQNTCLTYKLVSTSSTTIVYGPGTQPNVYIYDNTFVSTPVTV